MHKELRYWNSNTAAISPASIPAFFAMTEKSTLSFPMMKSTVLPMITGAKSVATICRIEKNRARKIAGTYGFAKRKSFPIASKLVFLFLTLLIFVVPLVLRKTNFAVNVARIN